MISAEARADRERLIASLGLPADAAAPARYAESGADLAAPVLAGLVDAEVTERFVQRWQASRVEQNLFRSAFRALLCEAAAMGYHLDRFESYYPVLAAPGLGLDAWTEAFERAVAARKEVKLRLLVHPEVRAAFGASNASTVDEPDRWDTRVEKMLDEFHQETGLILPLLELEADDTLSLTEARVLVNDAQFPRSRLLAANEALVNDTPERLKLMNVAGEGARNPANDHPCAIIRGDDSELCRSAGLTTWNPMGYAILLVESVSRKMAGAFVNRWLTECYCSRLERTFPVIVGEVLRVQSIDTMTQVLRCLVDEGISIRNLARIFEVLALPEASICADTFQHILITPRAVRRSEYLRPKVGSVPPRDRLLTRVRESLAGQISAKGTRGTSTLVVYLFDFEIEKRLADPEPLSPAEADDLHKALRNELAYLPPTAQRPVLLTAGAVRLRLRREIAAVFPNLVVLSHRELSPGLNIQPVARISLA